MNRCRSVFLALGIICFHSFNGLAQNLPIQLFSSINDKPIAYAHVVNQSIQKGTITDLEGKAIVNYQDLTDTIIVSYVGYQRYSSTVEELIKKSIISLEQTTHKLSEMVVLAESNLLYDLIKESRRNRSRSKIKGKVYFELASYFNQQQIEQLENYYNGSIEGADLENLDLYKGRIGLGRVNNTSFLSPETSETFYLHKTFGKNDFFPESPLSIPNRKLKKHYTLKLIRRYDDDRNHRIYVIDFKPNSTFKGFHGKVYIDSTSMSLLRLELQAQNASRHPFVPIHKGDKILGVDLELNKNFSVHNNQNVLNSIDFNYNIHYQNREDENYDIHTRAIIYAYKFDDQFKLPLFDYPKYRLNDYRKISLIPYDSIFWKFHNEFRLAGRKAEIDQFMNKALVKGTDIFAPIQNTNWKKGFFEHPYKRWSKERITFKLEQTDTLEPNAHNPQFKSDLYHLSAKLFVSTIELNNRVGYRSYSIFDPFETFYHLPLDSAGVVFINIYFDLVEIERRKMQRELDSITTYSQATACYEKYTSSATEVTNRFIKEVKRGSNRNALKYWNQVVLAEIGIDNIEYFQFNLE